MLAGLLDPRSVYSGGGLFFGDGVTQWAMRRAIVISVLVHLLILASLLEPPSPPAGGLRRANGSAPLTVSFKSSGESGKKDAALRAAATVLAAEQPARAARQERRGQGSSVQGEPAESLVALPADLEREYRIDLARAARRSEYYPAALVAKGQQGIVRMSISYWSRSGVSKVTLEQSSGYGELDQEALKIVALAIGKVPLPAGVQGINFRIPYALEYRSAD